MLGELIKYAENYGLIQPSGYKSKKGKWLIDLTAEGRLIDLVSDDREYKMCPHLNQTECANGKRSHFLMDSLDVVVNYMPENDKALIKHDNFIQLLDEASIYEPCLKAVKLFLSNDTELEKLYEKLKVSKAKNKDNVTFRVDGVWVLDTNGWKEWWQEYRNSLRVQDGNSTKMLCIIDGKVTIPEKTHEKISGLKNVGGRGGDTFICFDKSAFTSFGLKQSYNAACSKETITLYKNAMEKLINDAPRPIGNTLFLHWYKEPIPDEYDPFFLIDWTEDKETEQKIASEQVKSFFDSILKGVRPEYINNIYYILAISGASGRIMVRDWMTGSFTEFIGNIRQWFDDLCITDPFGRYESGNFKLSALMLRLVPYRKENISDTFNRLKKEIGSLESRIWRCIFNNLPLPEVVAAKALKYISSKLLVNEDSLNNNLDHLSCALLKVYFNRKQRLKGGNVMIKPILDEKNNLPIYQAGRLLAVLGTIQQRALGDVGAGIIQRFYTSASTTPKIVIGRLIQMSQHHLNKLSKDRKGLAVQYEKLLAEIISSIDIGDIPDVLSLEEQTLFALGYYHQKASMQKEKPSDQNLANEGGENNGN